MISILLGTRPELIKMYSIIEVLKKNGIQFELITTGQQQELFHQTATDLTIDVSHDFELMDKGENLFSFFSKGVQEYSKYLGQNEIELVVVHGDTSTTMIGAISAYLNGIPIAHIEAGARTGNLKSPWPEEGYRRSVDAISNLLFAPTMDDFNNLLVDDTQRKYLTGNTGVDSARIFGMKVDPEKRFSMGKRNILVTLHRRESLDNHLNTLLKELKDVSDLHPDMCFHFIRHPNPKVMESIQSTLTNSSVIIQEPMGYKELMNFLGEVWICLTDSGGLSLECVSLNIPVGILRDDTEEKSIIDSGSAILLGRELGAIKRGVDFFSNEENYFRCAKAFNPLGDGHSAEKIVDIIRDFMK
jgi:UDP-N-acetylglucosamine 2-epimerase (non-hydrolysing)